MRREKRVHAGAVHPTHAPYALLSTADSGVGVVGFSGASAVTGSTCGRSSVCRKGRDFDLPRHSHYSGVIYMVFQHSVAVSIK